MAVVCPCSRPSTRRFPALAMIIGSGHAQLAAHALDTALGCRLLSTHEYQQKLEANILGGDDKQDKKEKELAEGLGHMEVEKDEEKKKET